MVWPEGPAYEDRSVAQGVVLRERSVAQDGPADGALAASGRVQNARKYLAVADLRGISVWEALMLQERLERGRFWDFCTVAERAGRMSFSGAG